MYEFGEREGFLNPKFTLLEIFFMCVVLPGKPLPMFRKSEDAVHSDWMFG